MSFLLNRVLAGVHKQFRSKTIAQFNQIASLAWRDEEFFAIGDCFDANARKRKATFRAGLMARQLPASAGDNEVKG